MLPDDLDGLMRRHAQVTLGEAVKDLIAALERTIAARIAAADA